MNEVTRKKGPWNSWIYPFKIVIFLVFLALCTIPSIIGVLKDLITLKIVAVAINGLVIIVLAFICLCVLALINAKYIFNVLSILMVIPFVFFGIKIFTSTNVIFAILMVLWNVICYIAMDVCLYKSEELDDFFFKHNWFHLYS